MAAKISPAAFWVVVVAVAMVAIYCPSGKHLFLLVFVFDQFARDQFSFMCGSNCSGGSRVRDMRADVVGVPEHQTKLQRMVHAWATDTLTAASASSRPSGAAGKYHHLRRRAITQPDYCTTSCLCNCTVLVTIRKKSWNKMGQTWLYKWNAFFYQHILIRTSPILTPIFLYKLVLHYCRAYFLALYLLFCD
jgi:hypothetical protein